MTSNGPSQLPLNALSRDQRPRLLPANRKLRHLQGISLRNLALASSPHRARGKTFDDEALLYPLKSPTKLLSISEGSLHHSRSISDLSSNTKATSEEHKESNGDVNPRRTENTSPKAVRPRATLQRQDSTPLQRQQNAQDAIARRIGDVFFSLHCDGEDEPIYVSEVIEPTMNPDFRFFDLNACSTAVTRQDEIIVKFWAKAADGEDWTYLLEVSLNLPSLQYTGKTLEGFRQPLPENCLLVHIDDGIYTVPTDSPVKQHLTPLLPARPASTTSQPELSSSYDALLRLQTLDECIQDALATRRKLTSEISALISNDHDRFASSDDIALATDSLANTKRNVLAARRAVKQTQTQIATFRASLSARRTALTTGAEASASTHTELATSRASLLTTHTTLTQTQSALLSHRRRIAEDLTSIFSTQPVSGKALAFTICGLHLPNSDFHDVKPSSKQADEIAAALGMVAQVVGMLGLYLSVALPYEVVARGSASFVIDSISLMPGVSLSTSSQHAAANKAAVLTRSSSTGKTVDPTRIFPLTLQAPLYKFEYAVFLLNKDIELLASKLGLRILDIRQTLPNLKYILYVASAGQGAVPGRLVGGVRGLAMREKGGDEAEETEEEVKRVVGRESDGKVSAEVRLGQRVVG